MSRKKAPDGSLPKDETNLKTMTFRLHGAGKGYPPEVWEELLIRVAEGATLRSLVEEGFPTRVSLWLKCDKDPEFAQRYQQAKLRGVEARADECIHISDNVSADPFQIAKAKLMTDVRRWEASKLLPRIYGDKQQVDLKAEVSVIASIQEAYQRRIAQTVEVDSDEADGG